MEEHYSKSIIKGLPLHLPVNDVSVGKQVFLSLIKNSKKDMFINAATKAKITYDEYLTSTCKLAMALTKTGFLQNDIIAVCSENSEIFFEPVIACLYLGIIITPISHNYTEGEMLYALHLTKPKAVFCSQAVVSTFISLQNKCAFLKTIIVLDSLKEMPGVETLERYKRKNAPRYCDEWSFKPIDVNTKEQVAVILYSSGTTGMPKGVMTTHANINMRLVQIRDPRIHLCWDKCKLINLPFTHIYGFIVTLGAIVLGKKIVTMPKFNEELYYSSIENYKVNELLLVPSILGVMSKSPLVRKYDLSSVKDAVSSSAPLGNNIEEAVKKRLGVQCIRQAYGLTEATSAILLLPLGEQKPGSSGKVIPGMSVKIRDPKTGKTLGPDMPGELCIRGDMVMKGYVNNPKATKETITEDGWLLTGDLAYFDKEGYFYVVDRLKELIKFKGFQVAPAELEALLIKHPKIKEAGVVGVPDELFGELTLAFVVKQDGEQLTEEDVKQYVKDNVSYSKWLHGGVKFIEAIPRNGSAKILRTELKNLIKNRKSKL